MKKIILAALALMFVSLSTSAQIQLQVTGERIFLSKVYDGTDSVNFTPGTLSGVQYGDTVYLMTTARYAGIDAADSVAINVTYQITGPQAARYAAPVARQLKGEITRKQLYAVTQVTTNKVYDRSDTASSVLQSVSGIIAGDDVTLSQSAHYNDKNIGTYKSITVVYTMSGADTANYTAPNDSAINTGSISAITTTLATQSLLNYTKTYDGTDAVIVLNHGTVNGLLPGDDVQLVAHATYPSAYVGDSLDVTLTYSFSGQDGRNYVAPAAQFFSQVGKINRKRLTINTPTTVTTSKVYDRTTTCVVLSNGTPYGVMGSDRITLLATARYQDSLVGQNKNVIVTYQIYGQGSSNYLAPFDEILFAGITPRKLNIMPCTVQQTKVYDGNVSAQIVAMGALRNKFTEDSVNITATAVYDGKNVGVNKNIYVTYTIDGPDAANYDAPDTETVQFNSITAATVTATGTTVQQSRVYDSTRGVIVTNTGAVSPLIGNDSVYLSATASYDNKNVGTGKTITVRYTLMGPDAANYATPGNKTISGTITPSTLTIAQHSTVDSAKVYDGTVNCHVATDGTLAGVFSNDDVHLRTTATYLTAEADSGKQVILAYTIYGNDSANYITPDTAYTTADIVPLQLTITPSQTTSSKVYDGTTSATVIPGTLANLVPGDSVIVTATAVYDNKNAGSSKDIYVTYSIQGTDIGNYIAPVADTLHNNSITPLAVNARGTILRLTKAYDGTTQVTVNNPGTIPYLTGDNVTLGATATYDDKYVGTGKYVTINYTLSGRDSANYIVASVDTLGDITPVTLYFQQHSTVVPAKVYDGTTTCGKATDGTLLGVIAGDDVTLQTTAAYITPTVGQNKDVCVRYHLTGNDSANYRLYSDTMHTTASITCRQLTVSNWTIATSKPYDGTDTVHIINTGVLNNALPADMLILTTTASYDTSTIGNRIITVRFRATGPGIGNYNQPADTIIPGRINKIRLIVSGTTIRNKVYDGNSSAMVLDTGYIMNKVNPAQIVNIIPTASFSNPLAGTNKPATVTYTLTGADAIYYDVPNPDTTLRADIYPLQLTVSGTTVTATRPYNGTTACTVTNIGSLAEVLPNDSVSLSATANYIDRHAGTGKPVTVSYTILGPDAGNYVAPADNTTLTASITAVPIMIDSTAVTLVKQYDANTIAVVANPGIPMVLNTADLVNPNTTAYYLTPDIEQGKSVYVSYRLSGANAGNYIAPADSLISTLGEITRRKLVQSGTQVVPSRTYDATTGITVTYNGELLNLLPDDSVTFTLTSASYCTKDTGTHKEVYIRGTISGPDVSKYVLDYCDTVYADITPKTINVKGTNVSNKVYDGTANTPILNNGSVDGAYAGDYVYLDSVIATYSTIYPTNNATVTVRYTLAGKDAHNYTVADNVYTNMVISPATLRVRTNTLDVDRAKVYDATDSAHVADFDNTLTADDGVVGNDSVEVSVVAIYDNKNVGTGKSITVHFVLTGKDRGNYVRPSDITYNDGVITQRELTIDYNSTVVDTAKTYDGTNTAHVAYAGDIYGYIPCDSDKIQLSAVAYYDNAIVDSGKTITVHYTLLGTEKNNYFVQPTHIYRNKGRINPVPSDVEVVSEQYEITLAPNPAHVGETTYLSSEMQGNVTVEVVNAAGQRVMIEEGVAFPMEIEAPAATGIYFIRVIAADGKAYIRKLIVK